MYVGSTPHLNFLNSKIATGESQFGTPFGVVYNAKECGQLSFVTTAQGDKRAEEKEVSSCQGEAGIHVGQQNRGEGSKPKSCTGAQQAESEVRVVSLLLIFNVGYIVAT